MTTPILPLQATVSVINQQDKPAVMVRCIKNEPALMRQLISAAYNEQDILIRLKFRDRIHAINLLMQKGIIAMDEEKGTFYFLI